MQNMLAVTTDHTNLVVIYTLFCLFYRLATVLLYLNEPEKGGETAFPVAGNETFSQEVWTTFNDMYCVHT